MSASSSILTVAPFLAEQAGRQEFIGGGGRGCVCMGQGHVPVPLAATRGLAEMGVGPQQEQLFPKPKKTQFGLFSVPTKVSRGR